MTRPINRFEAHRATQCANAALSIMECEIANNGATIDEARETARNTVFTNHLTKTERTAFDAVLDTIDHTDISWQVLKESRETVWNNLEAQGYLSGKFRKWVFVNIGLLL